MHYHGYAYTGPGDAIGAFDSVNRSPDGTNFTMSRVPPFLVGAWLRKPRSSILGTWDKPSDALDWLSERYQAVFPTKEALEARGAPPVADRLSDAIEQLTMGNDLVWGAWINSTDYAAFYVVCCPNRGLEAPCPVGRTDKRPQGATTTTSAG